MAIIAISGKKGSGKDTIGKIMQILIASPHFTNTGVKSFLVKEIYSDFQIKKFADSLKDIMCILLGCTRDQLEDEEFKNTELSEEWWYYNIGSKTLPIRVPRGYYPNATDNEICEQRYLVKPTPRLLLQLMGTECGRNILHPNLWVNALMSHYKPAVTARDIVKDIFSDFDKKLAVTPKLPNWIITDVRFPNEAKAIHNKSGLLVRVNRLIKYDCPNCQGGGCPVCSGYGYVLGESTDTHPSETSLDNYDEFDELIDNNGTIDELIDRVREILIKYKYIDV